MTDEKVNIWMPFYISDYYRDTQHLLPELHGPYILLLMAYWVKGSALEADDAQLSAITKQPEIFKKYRKTLASFFEVKNGKWIHKRVESELLKAKNNRKIQSEKGKKGAEAKWHRHSTGIAQVKPSSGPSPTPSPSLIKKTNLSGESIEGWNGFFSKKDERKIKNEIEKKFGFPVGSEANTQNYIHVLEETESAKNVKDRTAYAIGIARNLK